MRNGDLTQFSDVINEFIDLFQQDNTYTLIIRLHHNVIKTGIRIICLSYSRISLRDIAIKLGLDDTVDAEYIVAKVHNSNTLEPLYKGHVGASHFVLCREVFRSSEIQNVLTIQWNL